ncbi:MAG: hypothetical protein AB1585_09045 [Thermodesulfobacteriota bacterium]
MTHQDRGGYSKKYGPGQKPAPSIAEAVKEAGGSGKISCADAFKTARKLKIQAREVGVTIDLLEIPIIQCQLGLFGYGPGRKGIKAAETVSPTLKSAIEGALVKEKLPCATAWEIAKKFKLPKKEVASACETLKIKISSCQLGTF